MPVSALVDDCPLYDLEPEQPSGWLYGNRGLARPRRRCRDGHPRGPAGLAPSVASKRWAFEQYDSIVQSRTVRRPGVGRRGGAEARRDRERRSRSRSTATGGGSRATRTAGTIEAVLECAQNLACVGAEPLGLTNCLNFGNPEKPHVAWQLDRSVQGLADACAALGVPVVGGNVSLYNETEEGRSTPPRSSAWSASFPIPRAAPAAWRCARATRSRWSGRSRRRWPARSSRSCAASSPGLPGVAIEAVRAAIELVRNAVRAGSVARAHDVSDGGLGVRPGRVRDRGRGRACASTSISWWSSAARRARRACSARAPGGFVRRAERPPSSERSPPRARAGVEVLRIGEAGGDRIEISAAEADVSLPLAAAEHAWRSLGPA